MKVIRGFAKDDENTDLKILNAFAHDAWQKLSSGFTDENDFFSFIETIWNFYVVRAVSDSFPGAGKSQFDAILKDAFGPQISSLGNLEEKMKGAKTAVRNISGKLIKGKWQLDGEFLSVEEYFETFDPDEDNYETQEYVPGYVNRIPFTLVPKEAAWKRLGSEHGIDYKSAKEDYEQSIYLAPHFAKNSDMARWYDMVLPGVGEIEFQHMAYDPLLVTTVKDRKEFDKYFRMQTLFKVWDTAAVPVSKREIEEDEDANEYFESLQSFKEEKNHDWDGEYDGDEP